MTQEDKAKRYDEIIEKANKMHHENCETCQICIEELIPELKESEDERIRKEIIIYLKSVISNKKFGDEIIESWIDWLEKQGKSALEAAQEVKVDNANKVDPRQEELTEFEKAVKQVMEEAIECGDTHNLKADADMLLRIAHKSAWSEEDKKKLNLALYFLNESKQNAPEEFETYGKRLSKKDYEEVVNWLKSLRPQNRWKPSDTNTTSGTSNWPNYLKG